MVQLKKVKFKTYIFHSLAIVTVSIMVGCFLISCGYSPEQYVPITSGEEEKVTQTTGDRVHSINTDNQICNSSISQDTVNFKGAMLWLGFFKLNVKKAPDEYDLSKIDQHDRLTITNYKNEVVWFLMKNSVPEIECEFQDPEWSAHPAYLSTLGQHKDGDGSCDEDIYSSYAIRTSDKEVLMINKRKANNSATPHFWVDPSVKGSDGGKVTSASHDDKGFIDSKSLEEYFGTKNVKVAWADREDGLTIYWADYSSGKIVIKKVQKPEDRKGWNAESPLFSPDGRFITFNLYKTQENYECWVQELTDGATPVKISDVGMDPRWWKDPWDGKTYIIYAKRNGLAYTVTEELDDQSLLVSGELGGTYRREFDTTPNKPRALRTIGEETLIINLPFKGGLSPDGKFMCTGTSTAYMLELK
ncbi:MAG: hypothetical protein PVI26_14030 [Chitinispirillia bacterium]|jgi:hypothetical protein